MTAIAASLPEIIIIIPAMNAADFIARAVHSILSQDGSYTVHLHLQDGGSTDDTVSIFEKTVAFYQQQTGFKRCMRTTITRTTDNGLYDAISKAINAIDPTPLTIVTWLGADDQLTTNSLKTVAGVFTARSDVQWLTGKPMVFDQERGCLYFDDTYNFGFSQYTLRSGWHDGRNYGFVQQEGCFWRHSLWLNVRGLDLSRSLAADWALWRAFAEHAVLHRIPHISLGCFTIRPGQKSADMDTYYREVGETTKLSTDDLVAYLKADPSRVRREFGQAHLVLPPDMNWQTAWLNYEPCIAPLKGLPNPRLEVGAVRKDRWCEPYAELAVYQASPTNCLFFIQADKLPKDIELSLKGGDIGGSLSLKALYQSDSLIVVSFFVEGRADIQIRTNKGFLFSTAGLVPTL